MPEHVHIPYTTHPDTASDPLRQFDLYLPPRHTRHTPAPLICFVHGGAWRSEDKALHADLARRLLTATGSPVAVPNYRLTTPATPHTHPTHAQDLLNFLEFILRWPGPSPPQSASDTDDRTYIPPTRLVLIGHSCSAHMLASIFLFPTPASPPAPDDTLAPSSALLQATRGLFLSEGIYDLDLLLHSFPTYKSWFVAAAFGDRPSYAACNVAGTPYRLHDGAPHLRWCVVHDRNDPLVDVVQSEGMARRLRALYGEERDEKRRVRVDFETLTVAGHNDIFGEEAYVRLVKEFVQFVDA